ncbi:MAG: redoxin domain-containing protein [Chloroflexota bacterium]|nr:redoxin domain-containing protein [Chloroflexota bacterium]
MALMSGQLAPDFETTDIHGASIAVRDFRGRRLMLAFFRFAACPYCNLRVHELMSKANLWQDHLPIIAVFQSPTETLLRHRNLQNFPARIIADPEMRLFHLYEGELSTAKFITGHFRRVPQWIQGVRAGAFDAGTTLGELRLVPAEMLIDEQGIIQRAYYGRDVTDHLPLRDVTRFAMGDMTAQSQG